jgi:hypothetical protein
MSEKSICNLCLVNEADQTGSHITSAFLLKSQIGKRGAEKAYILSDDPDQNYMENRGDQDIKQDFILCRECERRLSFLEGLYASEITQKIEEKRFSQNFVRVNLQTGLYSLESKRLHPIVVQLLLQSNIWRAAISSQKTYDHFNPSDAIKETMRANLDICLPTYSEIENGLNPNNWNSSAQKLVGSFQSVDILVLKAENLQNKSMTYGYIHSKSENPYEIILNEYLLFVFEDSSQWQDDFFEFMDKTPTKELLMHSPNASKIGIITNQRFMKLIDKIKELALKKRRENARDRCLFHLMLRNRPFSQQELEFCIDMRMKQFKG